MVDPDIEKYCCVILNYGNNYDVYWTRENVAIQLQGTHINFINTHPGCLPLYVFKNWDNHYKIATYALNKRKPNLKDGGKDTPLLLDGYYKLPDGAIVVHAMQTEAVVQKGLYTIITE